MDYKKSLNTYQCFPTFLFHKESHTKIHWKNYSRLETLKLLYNVIFYIHIDK